jgi:hypothetical protein
MIHFKTGQMAGFPLLKLPASLRKLNWKIFRQFRPIRCFEIFQDRDVLKWNNARTNRGRL